MSLPGKVGLTSAAIVPPFGKQLVQQLQSLPIRFRTQRSYACEVTARSVQAGYETDLNRIGAGHKDNGDRGSALAATVAWLFATIVLT
jgi:hypothetical protein